MGMMLTYANFTDPVVGIPVVSGLIMTTLAGNIMATQQTGEAPGGRNTTPGTDPFVPPSLGENAPGIPRGFTQTPTTGTLIVNGRTVTSP